MGKLGRNDPCWCGSGKKYKKCHYGRGADSPSKMYEFDKLCRVATKKYCMHPDAPEKCSKKIVKAHTISKSYLNFIESNGKVYVFNKSTIFDVDSGNGWLRPKLVGVNQASVFYGFCSVHDKDLFSKIEDSCFVPNIENCVVAAFRGFCHQLYEKRRFVELFSSAIEEIDKGRSVDSQFYIQVEMQKMLEASQVDVYQLENDKKSFDKAIKTHVYDDYHYYGVKFNKIPSMIVTGHFSVSLDFKGRKLQEINAETIKVDLVDKRIERSGDYELEIRMVSFNIFSMAGVNYVVFCWDKKYDDVFVILVTTLHDLCRTRVTDAIIAFSLLHCENLAMSPEWYDSLSDDKKEFLIGLAQPFAFSHGATFDYAKFLSGEAVYFDDWSVDIAFSNVIDV